MKARDRNFYSWILIGLFVLYLIYGLIRRQINERYLDESHIYLTVNVSKINFGRASTVHYEFRYKNKFYKQRQMCTLSELRAMEVGDIYLAKFNEDIEFSELMCGCKLSKSEKGKVWEKFPGCKN